ncbi:hypothetical protein OHA72_34135 [Dactylosporangium sp. NBC_01737]|nr:hypothetical protein OHA72_34135 [Dactylosporangium sp. NBC_01737]
MSGTAGTCSAAQRRAVPGEMLGTGDDAVIRSLETAHLGGGDRGTQDRVLTRALDDAAPPGIAGDVHHRRERPVDADRAGLPRGDRLPALDRLDVPRRRHRDRHREDRAQPVDDVEPEQHGDPGPVALHGEPLQAVDLGGVGHEQQRPRLAAPERRLHRPRLLPHVQAERRVRLRARRQLEVEVLGQLTRLLLRRHAAQQLLDPRRHRIRPAGVVPVGAFGRSPRHVAPPGCRR